MFGHVVPGALLQEELQSAGQLRLLLDALWIYSAARDVTRAKHGSGENTGEDERPDEQQVHQDTVHGGSLGTTPGKFGSGGNEVRSGNGPSLTCALCALNSCWIRLWWTYWSPPRFINHSVTL